MPASRKVPKARKSQGRAAKPVAKPAAKLAAAAKVSPRHGKAHRPREAARGLPRATQPNKAKPAPARASKPPALAPEARLRPAAPTPQMHLPMGGPPPAAARAGGWDTRGRPALGRGLSALIAPSASPTAVTNGFRTLPIERLRPLKGQPRKHFDAAQLQELAASIRTQGVLQPLVVRRAGDGYEIVAGERRWRAAAQAGLKEVPTMVKELTDVHAMQVALIENIQRADLDPIEEALAYQNLLKEHGLRHEDVAEAVGKNRVSITNSLRLLRLPESITHLLVGGKLSAGHARALLGLGDEGKMGRLAEEIVGRGLSVRDAELRVKQMLQHKAGAKPPARGQHSVSTRALLERLQRELGGRVDLRANKRGKGRLELYFDSLVQLDGLVDRLCVGG